MCTKACATRQDFSIESTASAIMSGDVLAIKTIYKFHIRTTKTIMYRIQSSPKRHLIKLAYEGVKLKKTLAITREASSEIYVPQYFKPKIKKPFIALKLNIKYFLLH